MSFLRWESKRKRQAPRGIGRTEEELWGQALFRPPRLISRAEAYQAVKVTGPHCEQVEEEADEAAEG